MSTVESPTTSREVQPILDVLEHYSNAPITSSFRDRLMNPDISSILVLPGGGTRGVYSAAELAVMERQGISPQLFDAIIGISAGGIGGAYFAAKQAEAAEHIWANHVLDEGFINFARPSMIMDMDRLHGHTLPTHAPLDEAAIANSATELRIALTHATTGETTFFSSHDSPLPIRELIKGSSLVPFLHGGTVTINGEKYFDGGYAEAIPLDEAASLDPDHIVILGANPLTNKGVSKPYEWAFSALSRFHDHSEEMQKRHIDGHHQYNNICQILRSLKPSENQSPIIDAIFPAPSSVVGRMETSQERLAAATAAAAGDMEELLTFA